VCRDESWPWCLGTTKNEEVVITDKEQEMEDEPQEEDVMGRLLASRTTTQAFVQEV